jgi:hypothetical protein
MCRRFLKKSTLKPLNRTVYVYTHTHTHTHHHHHHKEIFEMFSYQKTTLNNSVFSVRPTHIPIKAGNDV